MISHSVTKQFEMGFTTPKPDYFTQEDGNKSTTLSTNNDYRANFLFTREAITDGTTETKMWATCD